MAKFYQSDRYQIVHRWLRFLGRAHIALLLISLTSMVPVSVAQQPIDTSPTQGRQVSLRQQLTVGLKAVTKRDLAFLEKVIDAVEQGILPRKIVDSTFLWARSRAARKSYTRRLRPMVYFQPGLTLRAKRLGVKL